MVRTRDLIGMGIDVIFNFRVRIRPATASNRLTISGFRAEGAAMIACFGAVRHEQLAAFKSTFHEGNMDFTSEHSRHWLGIP